MWAPHPVQEASVAILTWRCPSSCQWRGSPQRSRKSQWAISLRNAPWIAIGFNMRIPLETAADISQVNRRAAGTARQNQTHLPMRCWSVLTDTKREFEASLIRSTNFCFLSRIRWKTFLLESARIRDHLLSVRMKFDKPRKYPKHIKWNATRNTADLAAENLRLLSDSRAAYCPLSSGPRSWPLCVSSIYKTHRIPIGWK